MAKDVMGTVHLRTCSPRGNAAMPGQKMSEKWWRRTRRLRSSVGAISFRRSYSRGTCNEMQQNEFETSIDPKSLFFTNILVAAAFESQF